MLWDPIRLCRVAATPEEKVRQAWIFHMIGPLGYPKGLLSIEKEAGVGRRFDLLCLTPAEGGLQPLLLMECKASRAGVHAARQALGYNTFLRAPFVCIADDGGAEMFWQEKTELRSVPFLPSYAQLVARTIR